MRSGKRTNEDKAKGGNKKSGKVKEAITLAR